MPRETNVTTVTARTEGRPRFRTGHRRTVTRTRLSRPAPTAPAGRRPGPPAAAPAVGTSPHTHQDRRPT
ncbi:hypothetical protein GCM10018787_11870 [Streptomyces thermodiastaticus]|nr:hypothetical protein GCM10018787_11870 [Streptomyces thermodiastaticus]